MKYDLNIQEWFIVQRIYKNRPNPKFQNKSSKKFWLLDITQIAKYFNRFIKH